MSRLFTRVLSPLDAERRQRLALARELADFRTTAEQAELESMLERLDEAQAREVRETLSLVA